MIVRSAFSATIMFFCASVSAETVFVKYAGPVDIDGMFCAWTESSFVHRICNEPRSGYTVVLLRDTYYNYCDVPARLVSDWLGSESKGRFYNANVKGRFAC